MTNLIEQLNAEARRLEVAATDESDGLVFEPVKGRDDLAVWIDQEVSGAYSAELLLKALKSLNSLASVSEHEDWDRENWLHVCFSVQHLEKLDVETEEDAVTYIITA